MIADVDSVMRGTLADRQSRAEDTASQGGRYINLDAAPIAINDIPWRRVFSWVYPTIADVHAHRAVVEVARNASRLEAWRRRRRWVEAAA